LNDSPIFPYLASFKEKVTFELLKVSHKSPRKTPVNDSEVLIGTRNESNMNSNLKNLENEPSEIIKSDEMIEMNFETDFDLPMKEEELK